MKRKNATRNALFTSIISLLLCVSMLVGTTFAWFTDSVVSGNNVIAAGNLDIELYNDGNKVTSSTNLFENVLWEPGVAIYENFTIKNEGNLALLYDFAINWGDYNTLAGQYNLTQILKVAMVDGHVSGNREAVIAKGEGKWAALDTWSFSGEMTKKGDTKDFALIIYWEPSDNDNNWNVQNGKTLDKGDHLYVNLGINLQATQKMHESDSFGPDYDSLANAWDGSIGKVPAEKDGVITLTTGAELAAFAAAVNGGTSFSGKTVVLGADINLGNQPWTAIGDCESGKYFRGTFDGQGHTIYNLSVDYSNDPSEHATAGLFGWVDAAGATVKNVKLENATVLGSHWVGGIAGYWTGRIENCSVSNSTIMGFNVNDDANGDKVGGIVGYLNEHSYINNNTVIGCDITGNREVGGIAGAVAKTTYQMNNNTVTNTTLCYSEERDYASAGKIVSGRTGYVANDTNVATDVIITHVIATQADFEAAVAAGKTEIVLGAGNYTLPSSAAGKALTISGTKDTKISVQSGLSYANGATVTFEGVTIQSDPEGAGYTNGFADFKYAVFNNCVINGTLGLDFSCEFNNCEFNISGDYYNVWTWGAGTAMFNGCTFNSDGKALLVYANVLDNGTNCQTVKLTDCVFNDNGGLTDLKAAIEIGDDYGKSYELVINNTVVNGYEINDKGINTGSTLWANKNSLGGDRLKVTIDGEAVIIPAAWENIDVANADVTRENMIAEEYVEICHNGGNMTLENVVFENGLTIYSTNTANNGTITLKGCTIYLNDGTGDPNYTSKTQYSKDRGLNLNLANGSTVKVVFENCTFTAAANYTYTGVNSYNVYITGNTSADSITFTGCTFEGSGKHGIGCSADGTAEYYNLTVTGCNFKNWNNDSAHDNGAAIRGNLNDNCSGNVINISGNTFGNNNGSTQTTVAIDSWTGSWS